jgi:hypothetical protein
MLPSLAGDVLNDALLELGLIEAPLTDPFASSDPNVVQMRAHLQALGRHLARMRPWSHLQMEWTLETVAGTEDYALPAGFNAPIPGTEWNRTTDLRLGGPLGPQGWQVLKSSGVVNPINFYYRITRNRLYLHPVPTGASSLVLEYNTAYWVQTPGDVTEPVTDSVSSKSDRLWFDGHLLSRGVKLRFLQQKGFDTAAAENEYEAALAQAMGNDGAQPVLDLAAGCYRPLVPRLPETNWGV